MDAFDYVNQNLLKSKKAKKLTSIKKKQRQQFLNDSCNVLMPSSEEESYYDDSDDSMEELPMNAFQLKESNNEYRIYCALCAGNHKEKDCMYKSQQ